MKNRKINFLEIFFDILPILETISAILVAIFINDLPLRIVMIIFAVLGFSLSIRSVIDIKSRTSHKIKNNDEKE